VPAGDHFKQVIAAQRPTRVIDEGEQQFKFRPPQRDGFADGIDEGASRLIERKAAKAQRYRIRDGHIPRFLLENAYV